jgi:hypothetical protein
MIERMRAFQKIAKKKYVIFARALWEARADTINFTGTSRDIQVELKSGERA